MRITLLFLVLAIILSACGAISDLPTGPNLPTANTLTPTLALTPTTTPSPTPSPTPIPPVRVETGDQALFNGDYARAREEYRTALVGATDQDVRAAALWGLGRVEYEDENYNLALDTLRSLISDHPDSEHTAHAYFVLAEIYTTLDRYDEALEAYQGYLDLRPGILDSFINENRGDLFATIGDYQNAVYAYETAAQSPRLGNAISLKIKIAQSYAALGAGSTALTIYEEIFNATDNDYTRAQMDLLAGQVYLQSGQTELAYPRFLHAVENYPLAYDSYSALVALVEAEQPVNELDRGLVDYFAGQYGVALAAFDRYIASDPTGDDGTAHYYRALTLRALGDFEAALNGWDEFIQNYPSNRNWIEAWSDKAFTQWAYLNLHAEAAKTLLDFVDGYPTSYAAPGFMREAARIYERDQKLEDAALIWERLAETYPGSEEAVEALFLAGITRYRQGNTNAALVNFQRSLLLSTTPFEQSRAYLWVGKAQQALGNNEEAKSAWQLGQAIDPTGYYSERMRDLLLNKEPFSPPRYYNLEYDLQAEREDAAAWVRVTFNLPPETDLNGPGPLAEDERLIRGAEYWELGLYDQARLEFENLRLEIENDPILTFRLTNYLVDVEAYRSAIFAARQVLTLAGLEEGVETLGAPPYFNHIRFGIYYREPVFLAADRYKFHPLFLYSVMRQESLFEGFVRSGAGARGLMQIIPSTGDSIAEQLGWPDYTTDDLYRPYISILFGSYYLNNNRRLLEDDLYAALAAYNGGPGNAAVWQEFSKGDQDLFLEIVRFEETRNYIRYIYEIFNIYDTLYSPLRQR